MKNKQPKYYLFYISIAALLGTLLYFNSVFFKGSKKYLGITVSKEHKISSERAATVTRVLVFPGQTVEKGQLLIELESNSLNIDIEKTDHKIAALRSKQEVKAQLINSEIAYLKAQRGIKLEEINTAIIIAEEELKLNKKMIQKLNGSDKLSKNPNDPAELKIASLKEKKRLHQKAIDIQIQDIRQKHSVEQELFKSDIELLMNERELMLKEKDRLKKYAFESGVVESVFVKENEVIESYSPLISINPKNPTSVTAYIIGKKQRPDQIGQKVTVALHNRRHISTSGQIVGFGAVTVLPGILQKSTAVKAYGLEVFIQIDESDEFVTGEKVVIN